MTIKRILQVGGVSAALILGVSAAHNADPTFAEDIAPIFNKNCVMCHRPGAMAPFSLLDLDSAQAYLADMKEAVSKGTMPPWQADGPTGVFRNDRRLADKDKQMIIRWLETGAKPGDMKKLPPRPVFTSSWEMGEPDLIVKMPADYVVPATGTVEYQYFTVPLGITEEKWVQAIEIMPGAREVVHHVLVYARMAPAQPGAAPAPAPPPAAAPGAAPAAPQPPPFIRNRDHGIPPDPPRKDMANPPPRPRGSIIGTTAVGSNMVDFPPGTALRLRPGMELIFQMHYTPHGHAMKDRSAVGFRFAKQEPTEEIFTSNFVNGSFTLPAGAKDVAIPSELGIGQPVKIYALFPHTHLRGTRWQYTLQKPDSTSEVILNVPRYDFNWQTFYLYNKPLELAPGSKINATAWYDNSAGNKSNPDPKVDVKWGDQSWEEMQYTGFIYSVPGRRIR
jgi:hypothetical protein